MSSVYDKMIDRVVSFSNWRQPSSLMVFPVWKSDTTYNHISDQVDQAQSIRRCFVMEPEFSDSCVEATFVAHPGIKVSKHFLDTVAKAALINMLQPVIKAPLDHLYLWSMGAFC